MVLPRPSSARSSYVPAWPFFKRSRLTSRLNIFVAVVLFLFLYGGYYSYTSTAYLAAAAAATAQRHAYEFAPHGRPECHWRPEHRWRYAGLRADNATIYLAANFYNNENVLPTFFQELPVLLKHLGPRNVYVSIYENGSQDKTSVLLDLLGDVLSALGTPHTINTGDAGEIATSVPGHRISILAGVRNKAMEPLHSGEAARHTSRGTFDEVLFMNDIFFCSMDVLEILYQKRVQGANQACATDWGDPVVYDRWVLRAMSGRPFYRYEELVEFFNGPSREIVPPVLPLDPADAARFTAHLPLQVFSCWNGATVFDAAPFLAPEPITFRTSRADVDEHGVLKIVTDKASECFLPSVDMWRQGRGKILMVPKASVAYDFDHHDQYRKDYAPFATSASERVEWVLEPPKEVAMQDYAAWYAPERWAPWDEQ